MIKLQKKMWIWIDTYIIYFDFLKINSKSHSKYLTKSLKAFKNLLHFWRKKWRSLLQYLQKAPSLFFWRRFLKDLKEKWQPWFKLWHNGFVGTFIGQNFLNYILAYDSWSWDLGLNIIYFLRHLVIPEPLMLCWVDLDFSLKKLQKWVILQIIINLKRWVPFDLKPFACMGYS